MNQLDQKTQTFIKGYKTLTDKFDKILDNLIVIQSREEEIENEQTELSVLLNGIDESISKQIKEKFTDLQVKNLALEQQLNQRSTSNIDQSQHDELVDKIKEWVDNKWEAAEEPQKVKKDMKEALIKTKLKELGLQPIWELLGMIIWNDDGVVSDDSDSEEWTIISPSLQQLSREQMLERLVKIERLERNIVIYYGLCKTGDDNDEDEGREERMKESFKKVREGLEEIKKLFKQTGLLPNVWMFIYEVYDYLVSEVEEGHEENLEILEWIQNVRNRTTNNTQPYA